MGQTFTISTVLLSKNGGISYIFIILSLWDGCTCINASCNILPREETSNTTQEVVTPTIEAAELTEKFAAGCHLTYEALVGGDTDAFALIIATEQELGCK